MIPPQEQKGGFDYANCNRRDWLIGHRNSGISILGTNEGRVKNECSITVCAVCRNSGGHIRTTGNLHEQGHGRGNQYRFSCPGTGGTGHLQAAAHCDCCCLMVTTLLAAPFLMRQTPPLTHLGGEKVADSKTSWVLFQSGNTITFGCSKTAF